MNKEINDHIIKLAQAENEGKQIQALKDGTWINANLARYMDCFVSRDHWMEHIRIKPEPKRVPLKAEDLPAMFWIRWTNGQSLIFLVTSLSWDGVGICGSRGTASHSWEFLAKEAEYSEDRKNWKPCWKEVTE